MNRRLIGESFKAAFLAARSVGGFSKSIGAYGKYYLCHQDNDDSSQAARAMQSLEFIPWPDTNCLIVHAPPNVVEGDPDDPPMCWVARSGSDEIIAGHTMINPWDNAIKTFEVYRYRVVRGPCYGTRLTYDYVMNAYGRQSEKLLAMCRKDERFPSDLQITKEEFAAQSRTASLVSGAFSLSQEAWHLIRQPDNKGDAGSEIDGARFLMMMSAIGCPTGYITHLDIGKFGGGAFAKSFGSKPIVCPINFDRLYHLYKRSDKAGDRQSDENAFTPRFVRGHVRHLWKLSGVPIETLPKDAGERVRLAVATNVRRTYVNPHWSGSSEFGVGGVRINIPKNPIPLNQLGARAGG